jgi:hypothetical protein
MNIPTKLFSDILFYFCESFCVLYNSFDFEVISLQDCCVMEYGGVILKKKICLLHLKMLIQFHTFFLVFGTHKELFNWSTFPQTSVVFTLIN